MTQTHKAVTPKDAATLIIIDQSEGPAKVLMGLRNKNLSFMPGLFVFPGGRLEDDDIQINIEDSLLQRDLDLLTQESNRDIASGLPLAAIRETFEETGILIGERRNLSCQNITSPSWSKFLEFDYAPCPSKLKYCARAITPENNVKRYDTRFFYVDAKHIAHKNAFVAGEFDEISWLNFEQIRNLELPRITKAVLKDMHILIESNALYHQLPIPFYYTENNKFKRTLIS